MAHLGAGWLETVVTCLPIIFSFLPLLAAQHPDTFDCLTLLPSGRYLSESQSLVSPCPIAICVGQSYVDGARYTPGVTVKVQFRVTGSESVSALFCRSSQILVSTPLGVWNASNGFLTPFACLGHGDALIASDISGGTVLDADWTPPATVGLGDMEIVCSVVSDGGKFWIWNSFMISESRNANDLV